MTLFLDFDGTLADISRKYFRVYAAFVRQLHGIAVSQSVFWRMKRAHWPVPKLMEASGLPASYADRYLRFFESRIERAEFLRLDRPFPGVKRVLERLSVRHECYVVSARRNPARLNREMDRLGLRRYFKGVVVVERPGESSATGRMTPKARALRQLSFTRPALFAGDSESDILTGRQMRMTTCALTTGICNERILRSYRPDFVLRSLHGLIGVVKNRSSALR